MKFTKKTKYVLIVLLVLLNFLIRIPSNPHETSDDSQYIHVLANSISMFGEARWWLNPLSIGGYYPYSYASAVPFMLSGISQMTVIDMEWTIWLFSLVTGIFSIFTAYKLAGELIKDDLFIFIVAFGYSLSPGILVHSTFNASTRGFFTILLPLFIYLLLKIRNSLKYFIITFVLFILLSVTHHYIFFIFPVIIVYAALLIFNKFKGYINIPIYYINILLAFSFIAMLFMPFFTRMFIKVGSKYEWFNLIYIINLRYSGILFIFTLAGFVYLLFKNNRTFGEWFLLLVMITFTSLLYNQTYTHFFISIFFIALAGVALRNISNNKQKRLAAVIIAITLILAVGFSGFYQHWRTQTQGGRSNWYMSESTYLGAMWIKQNINEDKRLIGNGGANDIPLRIFAADGGKPAVLIHGDEAALIYGFINVSYLELEKIIKISPMSLDFYSENPYVAVGGKSMGGLLNWFSGEPDIERDHGKRIVNEFNISYMIETTYIQDLIIRSVRSKKSNIYNNGEIRIWDLEQGK